VADKKRRKPPTTEPAPPSQAAGATPPLVSIAVVTLLVACYVVIFYTSSPLRQMMLGRVREPVRIVGNWFGYWQLPSGFFDRLPLLAVAFGIVAIAWSSGSLIVRGWQLDRRLSRLETELFSIGVGLSLWSTWTLLVGLFGLLHQTWLVWLPAVLCASLAGFQMAARRAEQSAAPTQKQRDKQDWLWPSMLALGLPFALFYVFAALQPPTDFDSREYHLQVPKEFFQSGRIGFLPHNAYGNMPLGAEMFALLATTLMPGELGWWYGALVGKAVMAIASILTALLLFAAGRRVGSNTAGVVSALVYISTPWIYLVSVSGRNEGMLAYYLALAVYAVWLWRRESEEADASAVNQSHLLKIAGLFAGSAAAVKYTGVVFVVLPLATAVGLGYYFHRQPRRIDVKAIVLFLIGALAACGLWYAKNVALTGNPVYPLASGIFGGATRTPEKAKQWQAAHGTPPFTGEELGKQVQRLLLKSEWLSPLLVPLAALAVMIKTERRTAQWLAIFLAFYLACWFCFTHRIDRFWTPALVIVAWLAGLGATWTSARAWRHVLITMLFWGMVSNFVVISYWDAEQDRGAQERLPITFIGVSLDSLRELSSLPEHRFLNAHVPRGYRALLVGDAEPFDIEVPVLYNTCFDDVLFDELFQGRTPDERLAALRERKIAYIVINWGEIKRYRNSYGFSDYLTPKVRDELVKQKLLKPVAVEGAEPSRVEVFEVPGVVPRPEE
jgi:hypothetical protein